MRFEDLIVWYYFFFFLQNRPKIRELQSTVKIDTLSDSWDEEEKEVTLKVYELYFTSKSNDNKTYLNFAMLIKSELDDDIANIDIDMFLTTDKLVKAEFLRRGEMTLDSTQVLKDKQFHLPIYILQFTSNKFFTSFHMKLIIVLSLVY